MENWSEHPEYWDEADPKALEDQSEDHGVAVVTHTTEHWVKLTVSPLIVINGNSSPPSHS